MDQKSKGQCFHYGERYHPLHCCSDRQLHLIILGDDEKVNEEGEVIAIEVETELTKEVLECKAMGVFDISNDELLGTKTMKMDGIIQQIPLVILVDSGASHNFISPTVVSALRRPIDHSHEMGV